MLNRSTVAALTILAAGTSTALADVRAFHGSPDAPAVDVLVNDTIRAFEGLAFEGVTGYAPLASDTYNFKVVPAGGGPGDAVIDADLMIDGMTDYTIVATDVLANITPIVLVDDNTLDAGNARIRFFHGSADAPAVDIRVANGGPTLFSNVSFQESGGYVTVPGGTYDLEVVVAGTNNVALAVPGLSVSNNTVYSVFATGLLSDSTLNAVATVDAVPAPGALALLGLGGLAAARRRR
ncbi:MAG: DUF4397 domain-containing protein [Phycisphaerales bacterium JB041]